MAVRTRRTRPDGRGVRVQKEPEQMKEDGSGGSAFEDTPSMTTLK